MTGRRGQASVEYMLLLCTTVLVAVMVGSFLKGYVDVLIEQLSEKILEAALQLMLP